MKSKRKLLRDSFLYLIIDKKTCAHRSLADISSQAADSGVDIIQLRDKESPKEGILKSAWLIRRSLLGKKSIFIVNDHLDVAKIIDSDGLHLGQRDLSLKLARRILGKDKIIGISCRSLKQARLAQKQGADYIGVGPIFYTALKPGIKALGLGLIKKIKKSIRIPFFVLGGIDKNNIKDVQASGVRRIALCRAICTRKSIPRATRELAGLLK